MEGTTPMGWKERPLYNLKTIIAVLNDDPLVILYVLGYHFIFDVTAAICSTKKESVLHHCGLGKSKQGEIAFALKSRRCI